GLAGAQLAPQADQVAARGHPAEAFPERDRLGGGRGPDADAEIGGSGHVNRPAGEPASPSSGEPLEIRDRDRDRRFVAERDPASLEERPAREPPDPGKTGPAALVAGALAGA